MKRQMLRVLIVFCLGLIGATATAENINRRLDAATDGVVTVSNIAGSVSVTGWSRNEVEVTGELGSSVKDLIFERDGNDIKITVKAPKGGGHNISSELVIRVPQKSSIEVAGVSADIEVQNVLGRQRLQTVSGDIEIEVHAADIAVVTVSGDVEVQGDDKKAHAEFSTVSGDIELQYLAGDVAVESVSGDILLVNSGFDRARLKTTSGDIVFKAKLSNDGTLEIETINGDVDVKFSDAVAARFSIETFNGDIRNCFGPDPVRTSKYAPGRELKFTEGSGEGRVTIETLNGDLRLCRD